MHFCEQCGSSSRDKDGFCGGCGAPWPLEIPPAPAKPTGAKPFAPFSNSPLANLPITTGSDVLFNASPKVVWVAVLLGLLLGPLGLFYCTITGAIVMIFVAGLLHLVLGSFSFLVTLPICAFWAWRAARESQSALD